MTTIQIIPLSDVPSQTISVQLGGQSCRINIKQKRTGLYIDLYRNDVLIVGGVLARDWTKIVRDSYLGFIGDLCFNDTQGSEDPSYPGIGSRYVLCYVTE